MTEDEKATDLTADELKAAALGVGYYNREGKLIPRDEAVALMVDGERRRVALDRVGGYVVSTVFLVLDHGFTPGGPPVLFETMVFTADDWDGDTLSLHEFDVLRYSTEDEARRGHAEMVTLVRATT